MNPADNGTDYRKGQHLWELTTELKQTVEQQLRLFRQALEILSLQPATPKAIVAAGQRLDQLASDLVLLEGRSATLLVQHGRSMTEAVRAWADGEEELGAAERLRLEAALDQLAGHLDDVGQLVAR
jgi:hypothetical protein